ncbi:hypothetical protein [Rhizobium rhizosphaerae]|uniref:hypothetical protein n=1 Tax=Xaviernesmea rhizosphaerae TaxID=1672749 RepID=UPI00117ABBBE|nr:hypothetical protein [Xaviernesmea rhizosphaerae]
MSVIAVALKHMLAAGMSADAIVAAVEEMECVRENVTPVTLEALRVTLGVTPDVTNGNAKKRTAAAERQAKFRKKRAADAEIQAKTADDARDDVSGDRDLFAALDSGEALRGVTESVTGVTPETLPSPEGFPPTPPFPNPHLSLPPSPPKGGHSPADFADFWARYPNKVGKPDALKAFVRAIRRADLGEILAGLERYAAKTDDRPWCNPATWLNQDRWADQPVVVTPQARPRSPPSARQERDAAALAAIHRAQQASRPDPMPGDRHDRNPAHDGATLDLDAGDYRSHRPHSRHG